MLHSKNRPLIRAACLALALTLILPPSAACANHASELPGRVVAIWSKGAGQFVRSPGVDNGVPRADRDSYDDGNEGRFLCFAEAGGTFAIMDVMLERYLTHANGQLTSAVTGDPASRRFTLVDQGNHYYAIRAGNGNYVRVNGAGDLVVDAAAITDDAVFAIVPIRTGPNVVMRAYRGDDPQNRLPTRPNEAAQFVQNPADFPVNKVNIGMLQMTPILYSDQMLSDMRRVWNTNRYETEFILPYNVNLSLEVQVDALIDRIRRVEALGYTFDYVILYHEILAGLPGGPWSDARVSSQEEIDLFRSMVVEAYNRGEVEHPYYKVFAMPYQFTLGGGLIQPGGCDAATLAFIKDNFDGMFLEVNGHDYIADNGAPDAALAAVWCRDNGLEFGITSGHATNKDVNYKTMYQTIFAEMQKVGFDKSWDKMHYILHHVYQPYENRLPEWVANTNTENSRWLIEQVMPFEVPSISPTLDTDGDGIPDLLEAINGTFPLEADTTPPVIASYSPAAGAADVIVPSPLVATFDENIVLVDGGIVTIRDLGPGPDVVITLPDAWVAASGRTLTITPAPPLEPSKTHAIRISSSAVTDLAGNPFAGIDDDTTWTFSTVQASALVFDNFSSYTASQINGQYGAAGSNLTGFATSGTNKQWLANTGATVSGGVLSQSASQFRSRREFATVPPVSSGKVYIRTRIALSDAPGGVNFSALELRPLAPTDPGDSNSIRLTGNDAGLRVNVTGTGGTSSPLLSPASSGFNVWLVELDLETKAGTVWLNPDLAAFDSGSGGTSFTVASGFSLRTLSIATYGASSSVQVDDFWLGTTLASVGVTVGSSGDFAGWIAGFGLDPSDQGFGDDPDGDGIPNGVEAWFGTNPGSANAGLTRLAKIGNVFSFQHPRADPPLTDVTGSYEWSLDLATWYPDITTTVGDTTVTITPVTESGTTTVTADTTGSVTTPDKLFLRAVATQN